MYYCKMLRGRGVKSKIFFSKNPRELYFVKLLTFTFHLISTIVLYLNLFFLIKFNFNVKLLLHLTTHHSP